MSSAVEASFAPSLPSLPQASPSLPSVGPYAPPPGAVLPPSVDHVGNQFGEPVYAGAPGVVPPATGQRNVVVQARSRSHRRIRGRSDVAIAGIVLSMAMGAYASFVVLQQRQELIRVRDGGAVDPARIVQLDDRLELATYMTGGAFVIGAIAFLVWFHRAYKNIKTMGRNRFTPGWTIVGWIVPLLNLLRPYQMMKELTTESPRHRPLYPPNTVGLWWATWLVSGVIEGVLARSSTDTVDRLIMWDTIRPLSGLLWLISGVLLITIIRRVTRAQDAWFDDPAPQPGDAANALSAAPAYPG